METLAERMMESTTFDVMIIGNYISVTRCSWYWFDGSCRTTMNPNGCWNCIWEKQCPISNK